MDKIGIFIEQINRLVWGPPMLILLFGTHIWMTVKTKVIQKKLPLALKLSVTKDKDSQGDISQFASLSTALASTIGTGNIIGMGTAIALGGPGAVLWCWLAGVFGIATKYAESLIAVRYRVKTTDGRMLGGAMYVLERGLNKKWLGIIFAITASLAAFGIGCGVQANAISNVLSLHFSISPLLVGIILSSITFIVIFGGVKSISNVCQFLVPIMSVFYMIGCFLILFYNRVFIIDSIILIIKSAFSIKAAAGGFLGTSMMIAARFGIARGLFSNESGMGSAPIVAAAAQTKNPVRQALVASTGTFWDTVVVCLITGIVLVSSMVSNGLSYIGDDGSSLTSDAFAGIPYIGIPILVIGTISFAYATILGWCYYGERCAEYLFGNKALMPYRFLWIAVLVIAPIMNLTMVWNLSDILNGLMAIPNLIALLALTPLIQNETNLYINNLDKKDEREIPIIDITEKNIRKE